MGDLADKLDDVLITVLSPDGNIEARVRGGQPHSLAFQPGTYERYLETDLAHQIARTATLLYVDHDRGVQKIVEDAGLHRPRQPSEAIDEAQLRYLAELPKIYATGLGAQRLVRLEAIGLMHWQCDIAERTLRYLPEHEFAAEVIGAAQNCCGSTGTKSRCCATSTSDRTSQMRPGTGCACAPEQPE